VDYQVSSIQDNENENVITCVIKNMLVSPIKVLQLFCAFAVCINIRHLKYF